MHKITGILILSLSVISLPETVDSQVSKTVYSGSAEQKDIDSLQKISWQEALPLILFKSLLLSQYPSSLVKAEILNGRLVKGTEFAPLQNTPELYKSTSPRSKPPQILLCPNQTSGESCLVPTEFLESQPLQCEIEPKPTLEKNLRTKCGGSRTGTMMKVLYRSVNTISLSIVPYSFCYDENTKTVLFADQEFEWTELFTEELLVREREITSEPNKNTFDGIIDSQYYKDLDALAEAKSKYYRFQKLVPTKNMALALWRKTTYIHANSALQHVELIEFWDDINDHIQANAKESLDSALRITTGVFAIPHDKLPTDRDNDQIYNFWITTVVSGKGNSLFGKVDEDSMEGIAILMNNFISKDDKPLSEQGQYIDELCGESSCTKSLISKFTKAKGEIRCCKMSTTISKLFWGDGAEDTKYEYNNMAIRNITFESPSGM